MKETITKSINESIGAKTLLLEHADEIAAIAQKLCECFMSGHKLLLCGNGGSASDAMHLEGEFICRFQKDRRALPAIALGAGLPTASAIGNDLGFIELYSRQVEAFAAPGDVLIAISTSGDSENIIRAVESARKRGVYTIGLLGKNGGKLASMVDLSLIAPGNVTARIQECHILIGHIICDIVETELFCDEGSIS